MGVFAVHFKIRMFAMFIFHNVTQLVMLGLLLFGLLFHFCFRQNWKYLFDYIIPVT